MKKLLAFAVMVIALAIAVPAAFAGGGHDNDRDRGRHHGPHHVKKVLVCAYGHELVLPWYLVHFGPNVTLGHCPVVTPPGDDNGGGDNGTTDVPVVSTPVVLPVSIGSVYLCNAADFSPYPSEVVTLDKIQDALDNGSRYATEVIGWPVAAGDQLNENSTGVFRCDTPAGVNWVPDGFVGDSEGRMFDLATYSDYVGKSTIGYKLGYWVG